VPLLPPPVPLPPQVRPPPPVPFAADGAGPLAEISDREQRRHMAGFLASFVVHTVVLLCLALVGQADARRVAPLAISSPPPTDDLLEEQDLIELPAIEIPALEADPIDALPSDAAAGEMPRDDLALADPAAVLFPADPFEPAAAFPDTDLLLETLSGGPGGGGDQDGGGGGAGGDGGVGTSFFGIKARGQRFVFVTDASGSMFGPPFAGLIRQLHDTIEKLPENAEFAVVFFNHGPLVRPGLAMERATDAGKKSSLEWVDSMRPSGGTEPSEALAIAFELRPTTIFLLTDGQFPPAPTLEVIRRFNRGRRVQIHTIALGPAADAKLLRQIAARNRGSFQFIRN